MEKGCVLPWYIFQDQRPFWLSRVTKWMCLDIGVLVGDLSTCKANSSIWWTAKATGYWRQDGFRSAEKLEGDELVSHADRRALMVLAWSYPSWYATLLLGFRAATLSVWICHGTRRINEHSWLYLPWCRGSGECCTRL